MTIGFIGAGVMARALGNGLVNGGIVPAKNLICSAPTSSDGQAFVDAFPGSRWTPDNAQVVRESDLTLLAIKPQVLAEALDPLKAVSEGKLILSIMAGVTIEKLRECLHPSARVVRAMPNTPMQIGLGASAYAGAINVTTEDFALVERVLTSSGKAWRVAEDQLDAVTALSGSGPAYVFHFIEALTRGGAAVGLPPELARNLAMHTVHGSAQLAAQSPSSPMELAAQVKSPRGTTLAGCAILEENDALNELIARCITAAKQRAGELARGEK